MQRHKALREVYRNYRQFQEFVRSTGQDTIEHGGFSISFFDLEKGINNLSPRKKQAFLLNVILDMKQRDVAEQMGITTVSVGQYVEAAMQQLEKEHFGDNHGE